MENGQKSAEWEAQVFNRSRTREEYVKLVATLIWKLRDYNKKVCFIFGPGHIMKTQNKRIAIFLEQKCSKLSVRSRMSVSPYVLDDNFFEIWFLRDFDWGAGTFYTSNVCQNERILLMKWRSFKLI